MATGSKLYAQLGNDDILGFVLKKTDGPEIAIEEGCDTCGPSQDAQPKLVNVIEKVYTNAAQTHWIATKQIGASPLVKVKMSAGY